MSADRDNAAKVPSAGLWLIVLAGAGLAMMLVVPATFVLICVGMAPTFVAMFIHAGGGQRTLLCTASLNLAGVLPVIGMLWQHGNSLGAAAELLQDIFVWGLAYGSAGLAMFLLWAMPMCARTVMETGARHQRWRLERVRDKLLEEWGDRLEADAAALGADSG